MTQKACEYCHLSFRPKQEHQKYCSHRCKKLNAPYYLNKEQFEKTCCVCGKLYKTNLKKQVYCSEECHRERRLIWQRQYNVERLDAPIKTRFEVLAKSGFKCRYCGRGANEGAILVIDHIIPVARGGRSESSNYVAACQECNLGKSDLLLPPAEIEAIKNKLV